MLTFHNFLSVMEDRVDFYLLQVGNQKKVCLSAYGDGSQVGESIAFSGVNRCHLVSICHRKT